MFDLLGRAVDELAIPAEGSAVAQIIALRDRLDAKITEAVGVFDAEGLWALDAAVSMTGWLKARAGMNAGRAHAMTALAHKLGQLPALTAAWQAGTLSSGQI